MGLGLLLGVEERYQGYNEAEMEDSGLEHLETWLHPNCYNPLDCWFLESFAKRSYHQCEVDEKEEEDAMKVLFHPREEEKGLEVLLPENLVQCCPREHLVPSWRVLNPCLIWIGTI